LHFRSVKKKFGVLFKNRIILIDCIIFGAFEMLRKATVSFVLAVLSVCPSVMVQLVSHWTDFHET
jgi:hypothetical protein